MSRLFGSKRLLVVVGAVVAAVVVVLVLLYGGISGVSLNTSSPTPEYTVTFHETGLATGQYWEVELAPYMVHGPASTMNTTNPTIQFLEPNGQYVFVISAPGYTIVPKTGEVTVNGGDVSQSVSFSGSPLGTEFGWGTPVNASGVTTEGCGSPSSTYCYAITISVGAGVSTGNILLTLRNDVGATIPWSAQDTISLFSPVNGSAIATYNPTLEEWSLVPPFAGQLSSGDSLVIATPTTESAGLLGIEIVAVGQDGFSGTVVSNPFS